MKIYLQYQDANSKKFWELQLTGKSFTVRYGRIGAAGQSKTKTFDSKAEAKAAAEALVASKRKKGYADAKGQSPAPRTKKGSRKLPRPVQKEVDGYGYVDVEYIDGLWRMREDETHEDGGQWHQHLTPKGVTVRSFYQHGDEIVAGRFKEQGGTLDFRLKESVQYGDPWSGKIWVHDAAEAVANGIAGVAIPSEDVWRAEFKVTGFDQKTYAIEIGDVVWMDAQDNKLSATGERAPAPTDTAVLVEGGYKTKLWRDSDDAEQTFTYYDLEGTKLYEEHFEGKSRAWLRVFSKKKAGSFFEWDAATGDVSITKGKAVHTLTLEDDVPVVHVRTKSKTKTLRSDEDLDTPAAFKKQFKAIYEPFLDRGVQLKHTGFLIDGLEVYRYKDIVDVSTVLRDYGGNECVFVHEPGPNQGLTFWNDHESGLFAMECLDEFVEEEGLEGEDANTILESIPSFMDEEYERSLGHLMSEIRWNPPDSKLALLDRLAPPRWG